MPFKNPLASWWGRLQGSTSLTPPDWLVQVPHHTALTQAVMDGEHGPQVAYCARRRTPAGDAYFDRLSFWADFSEDSSLGQRLQTLQRAQPQLELAYDTDGSNSEIQFTTRGWQERKGAASAGAVMFGRVLSHFFPPGPGRREGVSGLVRDWQEIAEASGRDKVEFILRASAASPRGRDVLHLDQSPHTVLSYLTENKSTLHAKPGTWEHISLTQSRSGHHYLPQPTREIRDTLAVTPPRMSAAWRGSGQKRPNLHMIQASGRNDKVICIGAFE